jgi:prolycopene isomerase
MMFGMGHKGTTNLITRALASVGKQLETFPDPTQIHYHLPKSKAHPQVRPSQPHPPMLLLCGCVAY